MPDKYGSPFETERSRVLMKEFFLPVLRPADEVLDIGAGIGHFSGLMAPLCKRVRCVELDQAKAEVLKGKGYETVRADVQDGLPYADGTFDLVASLEVIEHLERPRRLLEEAHRLLKKDGSLLISTPNRHSLEALAGHAAGLFTGRKWKAWDDSHLRVYSAAEFESLVSEKFEVVKLVGYYLMHKGRFVPSAVCFTSFNDGFLARASFIINILARPRK